MIDGRPRIGDEVYVHGYIDEIRGNTFIIRNDGGYFGTVADECYYYEEDEYGRMVADTPQTEQWHYNKQDSTWYPYSHPEEEQMERSRE